MTDEKDKRIADLEAKLAALDQEVERWVSSCQIAQDQAMENGSRAARAEAKLAVAREALEDAARKISECIVATERCGPADINVGRVQAYRLALSGIEPARTALNTMGEDHG